MALGETHWEWRPDVALVVEEVLGRFPGVTANTYIDHPWPGWDNRSADFWGPGGRGHPIERYTGYRIRKYLMDRMGLPFIRHTIYLHTLWTSFGGTSRWTANDHIGRLRHLHVTWW